MNVDFLNEKCVNRVLLLANPNSIHTYRWATALSKHGLNIAIYSLEQPKKFNYADHSIPVYFFDSKYISIFKIQKNKLNIIGKWFNLVLSINNIKKIIKIFKPNIVHAHYATSYGLLGSLIGFRPYIISVWGSDVYLFPKKSLLHAINLRYVFNKADKLLSTSEAMAQECSLYTNKKLEITPFGVDITKFKKNKKNTENSKDIVVIGTVKSLESIYGIDILIKAFKQVLDRFPDDNFLLKIVGDGSRIKELQSLVKDYNLNRHVKFSGKIKNDEVPGYLNQMDIFVNLSRSESFGVAVVEALACELPVIVSDIGGLPEVVQNKKCGIIVPSDSPKEAADALTYLIENPIVRQEYGVIGRRIVTKKYNWINNVGNMIGIYNSL